MEPELLDELEPKDPRAIRARRELRRLNALMGHAALMAKALRSTTNGHGPARLAELGVGDGTLLLRVARRLGAEWRETSALLLDRLDIVTPETRHGYEAQGWRTESIQADAVAWLERPGARSCDVMLANLFLHHFSETELRRMLSAVARQARCFIALEPRRSARSLCFSRLLWLVGCSRVTCYDGQLSVRAGFAGRELSQLWPAAGWTLIERPVGSFTHFFMAQRRE